ncbi:MAG: MATE family efflux transporter [Candidatus Izimaplasma sp.]|nr:MATE family efflux transporter [Candidatus Izimaplasma bacterium]
MNKRRSKMLENKDVRKLLIKLSIPATIGMMVNALYNLIDTIYVANGVNTIAIGALTYAFPLQMIIMSIGLMIGIGSASVFSRAFGRKDKETMKKAVNTALRADAVIALVVSVVTMFFIDELLLFFGATDSNIVYAKDYISVILIGLLPLTLSMVLNNLTRAEGRPRLAMISMIIGAGLNIILDPFFIFDFGLGLGVKGAAMATVISQIIAFMFIFYMSTRPKSSLEIKLFNHDLFDFEILKEIIKVGIPTFIRNSIAAFLTMLIVILIDFYVMGDHAIYVSIYGVINRLMFFLFMPAFGLVQGLAPITGYNFGAKNYKRLISVIHFAVMIMITYFFLVFLFVQFLSPTLFKIFAEGTEGFFITYGTRTFRIISIGYLLVGFQIIAGSIYQSFGYAKRALFISMTRQFIFFVPIVLVFTHFFQLDGIWYTFALADIIAGIVSLFFLIYETRQLKLKL